MAQGNEDKCDRNKDNQGCEDDVASCFLISNLLKLPSCGSVEIGIALLLNLESLNDGSVSQSLSKSNKYHEETEELASREKQSTDCCLTNGVHELTAVFHHRTHQIGRDSTEKRHHYPEQHIYFKPKSSHSQYKYDCLECQTG